MTERDPEPSVHRPHESAPAESVITTTAATATDDDLLAALADDFSARLRRGEHPSVEEYVAKHPQLDERIRKVLQALALLEETRSLQSPAHERPGSTIGRYKLLERIGEGGFGVVYMAEQQVPVRRKVALKVVKPGMDSRQILARFEAERQALALMEHPNIAKVLDAGATDSGPPYFVMELVKGEPITEFSDARQLAPRERLELFVQVCQAVQHAHQKGIIHRDLKPSNVLVMMHDTTPVVKVIDFGVAKALGQELTDKTLFTGFAQLLGTPLYMSPEQAGHSSLDVDTRSDIYSLGVLMYELLTGTTPFDKDRFRKAAQDEIRRIICEEEPPRPSTRLSESKESLASISAQRQTEPAKLTRMVRGELDWIVMKALEKDRTRRYETANGLAMDIQHYLHDEPVQACPPSATYRLRKFAWRNKRPLVAAMLLALVLILGSIISTWQAVRATRAKAEARAEQRRADEQAAVAEGLNQFFSEEVFGLADPERFDRANIKLVEALDVAASKIDSRFPDNPRLRGFIRDRFGVIYTGIDRPQQAVEQLRKAYELRIGSAGAKDPITISSRSSLGWALYKAGRWTEGRDVLQAALADQRQALGGGHPQTLQTANHLVVVLMELRQRWSGLEFDVQDTRDLDLARDTYRQALASLGSRHLVTLTAQSALAWSLRWWEKTAEALEHAREAMTGLRETRGREDFEAGFATYNYACCLMDLGRPAEATPELEPLLASRRRILGPTHSDSLETALRLAVALRRSGKPEKSLQVLEDVRAHLQNAEPSGASSRRSRQLCNLAWEYELLKRYDRAAEFHAAADRLAGNGPDDEALFRAYAALLDDLAWQMSNLPAQEFRNVPRAIELAERAVKMMPGEGRWWTTLGVARYRAGDFAQAKADLQNSIQLRHGGDSLALFFLSMTHWRLGEPIEARNWYDKAVQWTEKNQPKNVELRRFQAEAKELLKIASTQPTTHEVK